MDDMKRSAGAHAGHDPVSDHGAAGASGETTMTATPITLIEAVTQALAWEMEHDPSVLVLWDEMYEQIWFDEPPAHLLRVDLVHLIAHVATHAGDIVIVVQLPLADGNDHALALVFGGIAEQFIHHRPQALFFIEQRALIVRGAAAVAA